jgi:hypothetical protein
MTQRRNELNTQVKKTQDEVDQQEDKKVRAERTLGLKMQQLRNLNKTPLEDSIEANQINLDIEKHLTKTLQTGIL